MTDYTSTQLLTSSINVEIKHIQGNIDQLLYKLLKKNMKVFVIRMDTYRKIVYRL